jgi:hypothetical protein
MFGVTVLTPTRTVVLYCQTSCAGCGATNGGSALQNNNLGKAREGKYDWNRLIPTALRHAEGTHPQVTSVFHPGLTRSASNGPSGNSYTNGGRLMVAVILIALVVAAAIGWMMSAGSGPGERRYCLKCGATHWWHPKKGCEHCAWCERQW